MNISKDIDWSDPADRARLIESVGPQEYNRLHQLQMERETIEVVNGHAIRAILCRFGTVYMVDGTGSGHSTLEGAREIARGAKP